MDVLIFDDDTTQAELLTEALRAKGYTTEKYYNGQNAALEVKRQRPRLVIVDIMMPMVDGLTICRTIKSTPETSSIPVLVTSGKRYKQVEDEANLCGAAAFFGKPIDMDNLRATVQKLIGPPGALSAGATLTPRAAASLGRIWGAVSSGDAPNVGQPTSCVSIDVGPHLLVLDGGTGIKGMIAGKQKPIEKQVWLLLSNYQPDRIAGLEHLNRAFGEEYTINIVGPNDHREPLQQVLNRGLYKDGPPRAAVQVFAVSESKFNLWPGVRASAIFTMNPRTALAYRIDFQGRGIVYCPDNEFPLGDDDVAVDFRTKFKAFAHAAEILIHDSRYLDADFATYKDRGHSCPSAAVRAATEAGVRKLILFNADARYGTDKLGPALSDLRSKLLQEGNPLDVDFAVSGTSFFA
jgi:CheY-like chemotaxis protein